MNVCFLATNYLPVVGGQAIIIRDISNACRKRGIGTVVVTPRYGAARKATVGEVDVHYLDIGLFKRPSYIGKFLSILEAYKVDIVHQFEPIPSFTLLSAIAKARGRKIFLTGVGPYALQENFLAKILSVSTADAVSMNSEFGLRALGAGGEVIPSAVDLSVFRKRAAKKKNIVLCVARIDQIKGIDVLLAAMPAVIEKHPELKLVIVGSTTKAAYSKEIKAMIERLGLGKSVSLLPEMGQKQLAKLYNEALIFVLPSRFEMMPITALEAQACGLPVVATDVGGVSEAVADRRTLVEKENPEALAEKIILLLSDKKLRSHIASRGLEKVKKFDVSSMTRSYISIYKKLAGSASGQVR